MIIVGGLGSILGSFLGAALLTLLPALIGNLGRLLQNVPLVAEIVPAAQEASFGIVVLLFLVLEPEGLAKLWKNIKNYFAVWPFSYEADGAAVAQFPSPCEGEGGGT